MNLFIYVDITYFQVYTTWVDLSRVAFIIHSFRSVFRSWLLNHTSYNDCHDVIGRQFIYAYFDNTSVEIGWVILKLRPLENEYTSLLESCSKFLLMFQCTPLQLCMTNVLLWSCENSEWREINPNCLIQSKANLETNHGYFKIHCAQQGFHPSS